MIRHLNKKKEQKKENKNTIPVLIYNFYWHIKINERDSNISNLKNL